MRPWVAVVAVALLVVGFGVDRQLQAGEYGDLAEATATLQARIDDWLAARDRFVAELEDDGYGSGVRNAGRAETFRRRTSRDHLPAIESAYADVAGVGVRPWHRTTRDARAAVLAYAEAWVVRVDAVAESVAAVARPSPGIPPARAAACTALREATPLLRSGSPAADRALCVEG